MSQCPKCGEAWELEGASIEIEDEIASQEMTCLACGEVWVDHYRLIPGENIRITVEGGVIQDIDRVPAGMHVEVWDFDIEGEDESKLQKTDDGEQFILSVWGEE